MNAKNYEVTAKLCLFPTDQGGRHSHTPDSHFSFRIKIDEIFYDTRSILTGRERLNPGDQAELPIKFLDPTTVLKLIKLGDKFPVFEMTQVGELEITHIKVPSE